MNEEFDLIIHAGAPKCGSSSIQTSLSQEPELLAEDGRRYAYCVLSRSGDVLAGESIRAKAERSPFGYVSTPNFNELPLQHNSTEYISGIRSLREERGVPIISSEGWMRGAQKIQDSRLIADSSGRVNVVIYIRPPVDWINSAWWQWGAWTGECLDRFVRHRISVPAWHEHAKAWCKVAGVQKVALRLLDEGVVGSFYSHLNACPGREPRSNSGLPPELLAFLLRNREFRPSAHNSRTEFILARKLRSGRHPAPWVLSQAHVREIFGVHRETAKSVVHWLSPDDQERMASDRRWWTPSAYSHLEPEDVTTLSDASSLLSAFSLLEATLPRYSQWNTILSRKKI